VNNSLLSRFGFYWIIKMNKIIKRLNAVKSMTGLSRSSIYLMMRAGTFPKNISLGARAVGWLEADIQAWIDFRISATNAA
jgi:prophage regulatory protein